jgi:hypothetical protein
MGRNLGPVPLAPSDGERAGVRGTLAVVVPWYHSGAMVPVSGLLGPFAAFTRLISAISSLGGIPAARSPPSPLPILTVVPP